MPNRCFLALTCLAMAWLAATLPARADSGPTSQAPAPAWEAPSDGRHFADVGMAPARLQLAGVAAYDPAALMRYALAVLAMEGAPTARRMADVIAQIYREDGYPLAEVDWSADPGNGILRWTVSEGQVDAVTVRGLDDATRRRALDYLEPLVAARPLRQDRLERGLALAGDLAGISLTGRLVPTEGADGATLLVDGTQFRRNGSLNLDFVPMRSGYAKRLSLHEERYGLMRAGDLLRFEAMATRDPHRGNSLYGNLFYRTQVGDRGDYLEAIAGNARAERDLSNTPGRSEIRGFNASLAWGHPFLRDLHAFGYLIGAIEHTDSTAKLGDDDPRSEATAARLYYVRGKTGDAGSLIQYSMTLSAGRRPSTPSGEVDDGESRFTHLRGGLGLSGPWTLGGTTFTYRLEAAGQWTRDALPRAEKSYLGHYPYLRGYAPAEVEGDRGAGFTFEVVRRGSARDGLAAVTPFGFVSAGRVTSVSSRAAAAPDWTLASVGLGVRAPIGAQVGVEAWVAVPLRDGARSERGDPAFYLSIGTRL